MKIFKRDYFSSLMKLQNQSWLSFSSQKQTYIMKIRSKKTNNSFINPKTPINKFDSPESKISEKTSHFIKENSINSMEFDKLTEKVSKSQLSMDEKQLELTENNFTDIIPWNCELFKENPKEKNLLSPLDIYHIIKEEEALKIFKKFVTGLENYDFEILSEILENSFFSKLKHNLLMLKNKKYKISFEKLNEKNIGIDLFDIANIFTVGVSLNRKRNYSGSRYIVNDSIFNNAPIKQIILKRLKGDDRGSIIMQFHIALTSNILMKIMNPQNISLYEDKAVKNSIHVMLLEAEVLECDYKALKNIVGKNNSNETNLEKRSFSDLKIKEKKTNLKIIDMDNFMKGNELIKNTFFY